MRRIAFTLVILAAGAFAFATSVSADEETHTYKLEMYNAFGIVTGSEVKVAGVNAGTVESLDISEDKTALVEVELTGPLAVLGEDTQCSSEPQSLIAEYFIDCQPAGAPAEDGSILRKKVQQTVQPDLVQNTLREPFKERLAILINEFGTALAGNPENLNEAIRLGAPALDDLHAALRLLGRQNTVIRDLNVDSDEIIGKLADRREDVAAFIENAGEAAAASAERSDDLSRNFDLLDNFLAELQPTMVELGDVARETTPLLTDLRGAAPGLDTLATNLPPFNEATQRSLVTLGNASVPGTRAFRRGVKNGTFDALADSADQGPRTAELISDFARDVDDPGRIVEVDERAERTCSNESLPCFSTGRQGPTGYTGLEGLLNYAYYQAGSTNQYDTVGHLLHFTLYDVFTGPCGNYNAQRAWPEFGDNAPPNGFPSDGATGDSAGTTDPTQAANCVGVLGPNQPGITESEESICADAPAGQICSPVYDPSACPNGVAPADADLCTPPRRAQDEAETRKRGGQASGRGGNGGSAGGGGGPNLPDLPGDLPGNLPGNLPNPGNGGGPGLPDLPGNLPGGLGGGGNNNSGGGGSNGGGNAANDLLDFLFTP